MNAAVCTCCWLKRRARDKNVAPTLGRFCLDKVGRVRPSQLDDSIRTTRSDARAAAKSACGRAWHASRQALIRLRRRRPQPSGLGNQRDTLEASVLRRLADVEHQRVAPAPFEYAKCATSSNLFSGTKHSTRRAATLKLRSGESAGAKPEHVGGEEKCCATDAPRFRPLIISERQRPPGALAARWGGRLPVA